MGNVLEWYDFALYGYFAATLSPLFFPAQNPTISLLSAFIVFAIGYIMRPLGALVFGYIGDRFGRKNALSLAILLMAIPTTIIGLLPSYNDIGYWATGLLILCRLLQGLAVGGEFTGAMVFILEHAGQAHKNYYSAMAMASAFLGLLLGSIAASLCHLSDLQWIWRVPFVISFFLGLIGLYLRIRMPETPAFEQLKNTHHASHSPVKTLFLDYQRPLWIGVGLVMLPTASFYMCFLYLPTYLSHFLGLPKEQLQWANNFGLVLLIGLSPLFGLCADKMGAFRLQKWALLSFITLSLPLFMWLGSQSLIAVIICSIFFATMVAAVFATIPALLFDLFPARVRYSGLSFPYNLATALFGGSTPAINTALIQYSGVILTPALYLMLLALGSLGFLFLSQKEFLPSKVTQN